MSELELLNRIKARAPLGAPLYAYRVVDDELTSLKSALRSEVARGASLRGSLAAMFCLYAAEQFCRYYRGGTWAWKLALEPIRWEPTFGKLSATVQAGLTYWQRPIVLTKSHQRLLGTLVCEGGLPLHVLAEDRERHIKQFFRALIQRAERYDVPADRFVEEVIGMLPAAFRNETVGDLAATLADAVVGIRKRLPRSIPNDPIEYLNRTEPGWSRDVPIRVSEATFAELLRGLLTQPREQLQATTVPFQLSTVLIRSQPTRIERHAIVARVSSAESLARLLGLSKEDVSHYTRIFLALVAKSGERHPIAVARQLQDGSFRLERLPLSPIRHESTVAQRVLLSATVGGQEVACSELPGGQALLDDMPWIFEGGEQPVATLLAQGTCRSSLEDLLVALPASGALDAGAGDTEQTEMTVLGRRVVHVSGVVCFRSADEEHKIITRTQAEPPDQYVLVGELVRPGLSGSDYFRGFPELIRIDVNGGRQSIDRGLIQVRPVGARDWRNVGYATGEVDVRVRKEHRTVFRTRLLCLPKDAHLELRPNDSTIIVTTQELLEARLADGPVVAAIAGVCKLRLPESNRDPIVALDLFMRSGRATLDVPAPTRRAQFIGREGPTTGPIVFDRLGQVRAVAISSDAREVFTLEARLPARTRWLQIARLVPAVPCVWELGLERVAEDLGNFFANTDDLDTELELRLISHLGGKSLSTLCVRRYEATPIPQRGPEVTQIVLEPEAEKRIGRVGLELLQLKIRPLCHPDQEPATLDRTGNTWTLRTDALATEGAWLVTGHIRDRVRLRPLLLTTRQDEIAAPSNELERWLLDPNAKTRKVGFDALLANIACDWQRPDWDQLAAFVSTFGSLPSATFDVVNALSRNARAAAASLFRCGGSVDAFRRNWRGLEQLPFLWEAVRISDWEATANALRSWIIEITTDLQLQKLTTRLLTDVLLKAEEQTTPFVGVLHDLFARTIPYVNTSPTPYMAPHLGPLLISNLREEAQRLLARHDGEWWPTDLDPLPHIEAGRFFQGLGVAHHQPVLQLPFALGFAAGSDTQVGLQGTGLLSLRRARTFDPAWFEVAHAIGFSVAGSEWLSRRTT